MGDADRIQREEFWQDEEIRALQASSKRLGWIATLLGCATRSGAGRAPLDI